MDGIKIMKYLKDENNQVFAFEADGSQDDFIGEYLTPITEVEAMAITNPPPTIEEQAATARAKRTGLISQTDWTQLPDAALTPEQKAAWVIYRQALRDVTEQATFPTAIDWPVAP